MSSLQNSVRLIFPHQLFKDHLKANEHATMLLIEDDLYFKQYRFHKQKLLLHRASMKAFADVLEAEGFETVLIETSAESSMKKLKQELTRLGAKNMSFYDVADDWLEQSLDTLRSELNLDVERLNTPAFLTTRGMLDEYFENNPNRMQHFYEWQRKRLNILMNGTKPEGGKWSFDAANRKKLPKSISLPQVYRFDESAHLSDAKQWVNDEFSDNPGNVDSFSHAITHEQAEHQLKQFLQERLSKFGPYEDAISSGESQLFHSVLSPALNCGLLTPQQVIDEVLNHADSHDIQIESLEGFVRQVIGWREYMRATYVRYGRRMRTSNYLDFKGSLDDGWWTGKVGIGPVDTTITRILDSAYAHHIERLMVLGNIMVLLRINPDEVYKWFMSLFIDAYDWVMVPNVYAMSQFAAGDMITTKPYVSGSNYILKMSDYTKGEWSDVWDALYWQFISDHREMIEKNYRMKMVVNIYDKFSDDKKKKLSETAKQWLM